MNVAVELDEELDVESKSTANLNKDDLKHLILHGVKLTDRVLGKGSFGTVYEAKYNGTVCAAKRVDTSRHKSRHLADRVAQNFLQECLQHFIIQT